jgi:hypothetical protein
VSPERSRPGRVQVIRFQRRFFQERRYRLPLLRWVVIVLMAGLLALIYLVFRGFFAR